MKVLVTGGSGYVGRFIVSELQGAGHSVTVFDLVPPNNPTASYIQGDVLSLEQLEAGLTNQEGVIHLAAYGDPLSHPPEKLFELNVTGMFNVIEAAVRSDIKKFVMASSDSILGFVYGENGYGPLYFPIDEQHPLQPQDLYGLSKLIDEEICRSYSLRYDISTISLRICLVWDPEQAETLKWIVEKAIERSRGLWVYVDGRDTGCAFRLALEAQLPGHETMFIAASDALAREKTTYLVERFYPHVEIREHIGDYQSVIKCAKAKRLLGFQPQYSWRDSLHFNLATTPVELDS